MDLGASRGNAPAAPPLTGNQEPHRQNRLRGLLRTSLSFLPLVIPALRPDKRPQGLSVFMRVKDEADWIGLAVQSILPAADEVVIVDNGSTDGTFELAQRMAAAQPDRIRLRQEPDLDIRALSQLALGLTRFRWVFRWDGDMVAHTTGPHSATRLRERILALDSRRCHLIYLRLVNLAGDLGHQDPAELVHIEEYIHTFAAAARYEHPGRFEAVRFPKWFQPHYWFEPYGFHVNIKPAARMLLRHFWGDWMELHDPGRFPTLAGYAATRLREEFGTGSFDEAADRLCGRLFRDLVPYDLARFGPCPELLQAVMSTPKYRLRRAGGTVVGRDEG